MQFLKRALPFLLTLIVGLSLGGLLKHRHHHERRCPPAESYGGVYDGDKVVISLAPNTYALTAVSRKAVILAKPEPLYTEEARGHGVAGTVRLRMLLSAAGEVTRIEPVTTLPAGLTESAVDAARRIAFVPALKDGQPVSQFITVDYRFDLQ